MLQNLQYACAMDQKELQPNFIRQWRKHRGLTLRELEEKMFDENGDTTVSFVSIGRIETGKQPYNQLALEAIAKALDTTPVALISQHPDDVDPLTDFIKGLSDQEKLKALNVLKAMFTSR
ncbi:Transcriptional regulator, contains XRE-family HTH domain [Cohaesibacter marisflavi]|uniref:Transcriptional regulator, contains XRE-family HTH domain n=1 Tax=Cohaesibacter marisflavi TaxID=655353 RepID=A0A1I5JX00_9HYPH|nr:helix-turn-helix transcriptional regulator [Cohaesibacter marisflavi]SFO77332.1 Transcriptional regulator, contains XRE-family HTH domain [Cohaesibacter marisflavi]